jgi:DNA polymerase-3 subunit gamma/tau
VAVTVDGGASSSARAPASTSSPARAEPVAGARDPVQALIAPRAPRSSDAPSSAASGPDALNAGAAGRPGPAASRRVQPGEPGKAPASGAAAGDPMAGALADALGKVTRWMASEPRERPGSRAGHAADGSGPQREAAPPISAPRGASARRAGDAAAAALLSAAGLQAAAAPPRLTVGRIDVQVVAPPAPVAPAASVPARSARSAPSPAPSSGPSPAAYLSFGLRQR